MASRSLLLIGLLLLVGIGSCSSEPTNNVDSRLKPGCTTKCNVPNEQPYCTDPTIDSENCGACGNVCPIGQHCVDSACVCPTATPNACGTGATAFCTRFDTDPLNCGACDVVCQAGLLCSADGCKQTCASGTVGCPATGTPTYCAALASDNLNCGGCGVACAAGRSCQGGQCACAAGLIDCGGTCTNPAQDINNCGTCGVACPAGMVCTADGCKETCAEGTNECPATGTATYCAALSTDNANCGSCGNVCPSNQKCAGAMCCAPGKTGCNGSCLDLSSDPLNCGACGNVCPTGLGWACVQGACKQKCGVAGQSCCDAYVPESECPTFGAYPCTSSSLCGDGLTCANYRGSYGGYGGAWCADCGSLGGACCTPPFGQYGSGPPCKLGLGCSFESGSSSCQACGNLGQQCCSGPQGTANCNSYTFTCFGPNGAGSGTCQSCGHEGQPCCGGSYCGDGSKCVGARGCLSGVLTPGEKLLPGQHLRTLDYRSDFSLETNMLEYLYNGSGWLYSFGAFGGYAAFTASYALMGEDGYFGIYDTNNQLRFRWGDGVAGSFLQAGVVQVNQYQYYSHEAAIMSPSGTVLVYLPGELIRY